MTVTLDELQRVLGGTVQDHGPNERYLETRVGGLRAVIRPATRARVRVFDLAVFSPAARELDPFHHSDDDWHLGRVVTLRAGYVFAGCSGGVLRAVGTGSTSLRDLIGTLWDLARWAREPWRPVHWQPSPESRKWSRLEGLEVAAVVVLIVAWLRG